MHRDVYVEVHCCSFLILSLTASHLRGVYGQGIRHSVCTRAKGWHNVYWSTSVKLHTRQQRALKKWEQIRAHEQGLHVSQEVLEGGKGRQLRMKQMCLLASLYLLGFPDHLREISGRVKLLAVNSSLFTRNKIIQISWKIRFYCN